MTNTQEEWLEKSGVYDHVELLSRLAGIYTLEGVVVWITGKHKLLGGLTPLEVWNDGKHNDVLALVEQMETGAFV